ncbi:hypothetical protein SLE2022_176140 [Rubroshorea leprosula]
MEVYQTRDLVAKMDMRSVCKKMPQIMNAKHKDLVAGSSRPEAKQVLFANSSKCLLGNGRHKGIDFVLCASVKNITNMLD